MISSHASYEPKLRVPASGLGGSGYKIPTRLQENGKPIVVPGVTTVTGALDKGGVVQWAVDNTAAFAVANIESLMTRTEEQGFGFLRFYPKRFKERDFDDPTVDIRDYSNGVLDDLAELGTLTHDWVADHILGNFEPDLVRPEQAQMAERFMDWEQFHVIDPILVESTLVGEGYAGTIDHLWDIMCLHDDPCFPGADERPVRALIDAKTSRNTHDTHYAQLGALGAAEAVMVEVDKDTEGAVAYKTKEWGTTYWIEKPFQGFEFYGILRLRPDDPDKDGGLDAYCKMVHVPHPVVDEAWEIFKGALQARHGQQRLRNIKREYGIK